MLQSISSIIFHVTSSSYYGTSGLFGAYLYISAKLASYRQPQKLDTHPLDHSDFIKGYLLKHLLLFASKQVQANTFYPQLNDAAEFVQ